MNLVEHEIPLSEAHQYRGYCCPVHLCAVRTEPARRGYVVFVCPVCSAEEGRIVQIAPTVLIHPLRADEIRMEQARNVARMKADEEKSFDPEENLRALGF
ncbi:hypothetical protein D6833_13910 [Candidatus Parcubacteria bacterium]|nr:MAG: hypothetical protein D6833_13910 [Candidatus Parcubacteria bacterium]